MRCCIKSYGGKHGSALVSFTFKGKRGQVVLDQIDTVDKSRLVQKFGVTDRKTQPKVLSVIAEMFAP
jgi:mRNA interferase MazF